MTTTFILIGLAIIILAILSFKLNRRLFNMGTTILTAIFSFIAIVAFWYFIYKGDVYDNWYPLVGHFVSAHGAFIGILLWQHLENTGMTLIEWFISIKNKLTRK